MFSDRRVVAWARVGPGRDDAAAMPETAVAPPPFPGRGGHDNGGRGGAPAGIGLLRDPDHYEEINVIGNGKFWLFSLVLGICLCLSVYVSQ